LLFFFFFSCLSCSSLLRILLLLVVVLLLRLPEDFTIPSFAFLVALLIVLDRENGDGGRCGNSANNCTSSSADVFHAAGVCNSTFFF
jgi:hypothetical protein